MSYRKFDELMAFLSERKHVSRVFSDTKVKNAHYANGVRGCKRKLVYQFTGVPEEPMNLTARIVTGMGDKVQELIEKELIGCKIFEAHEESISFKDDRLLFPFSMRIDVLVTLPKEIDSEQLMRPLEIKSITSSQYYDTEYPSWNGRPPLIFDGAWKTPKEDHRDQLNLYLHAMKVDYGILCVINRDDGAMTLYKVEYDSKRHEEIVQHCIEVEKSLKVFKETGLLPERIIEPLPLGVYTKGSKDNPPGTPKLDKSSFPCIWRNKETGKWGMCSFFNTCHKDTMENLGLNLDSFKK